MRPQPLESKPGIRLWRTVAAWALVCGTAPVMAAELAAQPEPSPDSKAAPATRTSLAEPSAAARQVASWAVQSHNHLGRPFVVVDKRQARVLVFGHDGRLEASSPVLLGAARGDHSVPGIGHRKMADIRPHERTTPAGRFVAEPGRNAQGEDIVWVDYDAAVSMHRVRATDPKERRLQRLASATAVDNRISYGCINVPAAFYDQHIRPLFTGAKGIVYVLPEALTLSETFGIGTSGTTARSSPDQRKSKT